MSAAQQDLPESKADMRRAQILAAAEQCFVEHGFHRASVSMICRAAGMSPGHVYHYFDNKEAIIAAIVRRDLDRLLEMTEGMRASDDVLAAMIARVPEGVAEKLEPRAARLRLEIAAEASRNEAIAGIVREADACSRESLKQTLRLACRDGRLAEDEQALDLAVETLAAMFDGLAIRAARNPGLDAAGIAGRFQLLLRALVAG